jgi:Holliday junction resolvase RusA-like endonuclease
VIAFTVACDPPTTSHHRKEIIRLKRYNPKLKRMTDVTTLGDSKELVLAKNTLEKLFWPHRPAAPLEGALTLTIEFTFPWREKDSARTRGKGRIPRDTRPDCSNLAKTAEDRLVHCGFLKDDGQVVELVVRKYFGAEPGISIRLAPFEPSGDLFHSPESAAPPSAARTGDVQ